MHNKYGKRESDAPLVKGGQGRTRQETETNAIITASFLLARLNSIYRIYCLGAIKND